MTFDVIVLGAGQAGLALGHSLAARDAAALDRRMAADAARQLVGAV
jgi:2-polyprenyl-6-methoxyphenol hydroxylase-like FAD-dependent oxidoreductase